MRWFGSSVLCFALLALVGVAGCSSGDDGSVTDDSSEIVDGKGRIERNMDPPKEVPESDLIGASMEDILAEARETGTEYEPEKSNGCETVSFKNGKKLTAEQVICKGSEVIRFYASDGRTIKAEHSDLNRDGKVDRVSSEKGKVAQYVDMDFDGRVDKIVELVEDLDDFSLDGYSDNDSQYEKSNFLYRIREDRDFDGKFDFESMTAKGLLPKSAEELAAEAEDR